ncbi:MAG: hypothetical protein DMF78_24165 [Acidobacteria bacterium]|nr:MAG: hypothetical protein DMF78_24165 [Acidobacteriota bacterium]
MTPPSLTGLQSAVKRYLFAGDNEAELAAQVTGVGGIPAETRLDVYRNAYYLRLEEALARDFPALRAVVGDEAFGGLAAGYLTAHPSLRPSLRFLGQHLQDCLRHAREEPALADLAALEWAVLHAFDAPDAPALTVAGVGGIPGEQWPELPLALHPSVTLLALEANAREVWLAVRRGDPVPALHPVRERLVVWRGKSEPQVEAISAGCYALLAAVAKGASFASACEALAELAGADAVPRLAAESLHWALAREWLRPTTGGAHTGV